MVVMGGARGRKRLEGSLLRSGAVSRREYPITECRFATPTSAIYDQHYLWLTVEKTLSYAPKRTDQLQEDL
jgi:hypothetical protein